MEAPAVRRPAPLLAAAGVALLQGVALIGFGVLELAHLDGRRIALALTTGLFFALLGVGLGCCGAGLVTGRSWARGPVVVVQLIGLLTAFSFWGGDTTPVAIVLGLVCLVALVGVLHPASTRALGDGEQVEPG